MLKDKSESSATVTRVYKYVKEGLFATLNVIQIVDNQNVVFVKKTLSFVKAAIAIT